MAWHLGTSVSSCWVQRTDRTPGLAVTPHTPPRVTDGSLCRCVVLCCVVLCFIYWSGRGEVSRFDLDEAILRRMPRRLLVDVPDAKGRKMILEKLLQTVR